MNTLVLKLLLTPALIGTASLAGRRWGPTVSGWLIGLPFTSGPVLFLLALSSGTRFAATAAAGTLTGTLSQVGFCLTYAWLARLAAPRRGWPLAYAGAIAVFALETFTLQFVVLPLWALLPLVLGGLALTLWLLPVPAHSHPDAVGSAPAKSRLAPNALGPAAAQTVLAAGAESPQALATAVPRGAQTPVEQSVDVAPPTPPRWDLPARMVLATGFVLALTALAPALGAHLTGLLAPFPLFASILTVFAHQQQGPEAAIGVLRGLVLGLFAFAGFCVTVAALLVPVGIAGAFAAAIALALATQGISLAVMRHGSH